MNVFAVMPTAAGQVVARVFGSDGTTILTSVDFDPNFGNYLFTSIDVTSGQTFYLEITHLDDNADQGFYYISVGQPLASGGESAGGDGQNSSVYLPVIIK